MTDVSARPRSGRARSVAWVFSTVMAGLSILLLIAYAVVLLVGGVRKTGALGSDDQAAVDAGAQTAVNLLSYSQKNFDSDFTRALNGTTGDLRTQISAAQAKTKAAVVTGKIDLSGVVQAKAYESSSDGSVLVLVVVTGYQTNAAGTKTATPSSRLELTMQKVNGTWLAANLSSIGVV